MIYISTSCKSWNHRRMEMRRNIYLRTGCIKAILDYLCADFIVIICCWFKSYILFCFCFKFSNIWENTLACIMWVIQLKFTKYILCTAKSLYMKCFDAEKQHSWSQANIFRLFVLIKQWNETFLMFGEVASLMGFFLAF